MLKFALLVVLLGPIQNADHNDALQATDQKNDGVERKMLRIVSSRLKEQQRLGNLGRRFLEVTVDRENAVIVTGKIVSSDEAKAIVEAVSNVDGIEGIVLNLGINRQPRRPSLTWPPSSRPHYHSRIRRTELNWDDNAPWPLNFDSIDQ